MKKFDKLSEVQKSNYESVFNSLQLDCIIDYIVTYGLDALIYELNRYMSPLGLSDPDLDRFCSILQEDFYNDLYED